MVNIFITNKFLPKYRHIPILFPFLGVSKNPKHILGAGGSNFFNKPVFNLVKDVKEADFILAPHEYFDMARERDGYLDSHVELSRLYNKKLIIFDSSDYSDKKIDVPNSIVFRIAGYRNELKENEVIMPCFIQDLAIYVEDIYPRQKDDNIPVVGFCGWGKIDGTKQKMKFWTKTLLNDLLQVLTLNPNLEFKKQGLYFRMKALNALNDSKLVKTNFIIRESYSSHANTIKLPVDIARSQFVNNILNSDLSLSVRGDANNSYRFYEILSLGRIPLFVDTDCVLPLEDIIDYKSFVCFVGGGEIKNIGTVASSFFRKVSKEEFLEKQKKARLMFEKYLNPYSFFLYTFSRLLEQKQPNH